MSVQANPMVVVKKADGTTVRVPLSELRKKSQPAVEEKQVSATPVVPPIISNQPLLEEGEPTMLVPEVAEPVPTLEESRSKMHESRVDLSPSVKIEKEIVSVAPETKGRVVVVKEGGIGEKKVEPVVEIPAPVLPPKPTPVIPPAKKIIREEPLLNETLQQHELKKPDMLGTLDYDAIAENIINGMAGKVLITVRGRAHSLCVSWLRGVRDDEQFTRYATLAPESGGVGMSAADTAFIIQKLRAAKGEPIVKDLAKAPDSLIKNIAPANSTVPNQPVDIMDMVGALAAKTQTIPRAGTGRVLHDVQSPTLTQVVTGPAEEMRSFSLTDWRRLGGTAATAHQALLAKCSGWKEESYLLFLDARAAWRESPLMQMYREKVVAALQTGRTLADTVGVPANNRLVITTDDLLEIAALNRDLDI